MPSHKAIKDASLVWVIVFTLLDLFIIFVGIITPMTCYEYPTIEEVRWCARWILSILVVIPLLTMFTSLVFYGFGRYVFAMIVSAIPCGMILFGMVMGGVQQLLATHIGAR